MALPDDILKEIREVTSELIKVGLSDEQNFPSDKSDGNIRAVSICGHHDLSITLKNIPYKAIYEELIKSKLFNIKLIDGGLVQFMYTFFNNELIKHRLAYFSSPFLESYQNDPEIYEDDDLYADFIQRNIVSFPIRFDYDIDNEKHIVISHPKSHLTLGQYLNCRIPVCSPVTPSTFILFILRNFYNTAFKSFDSTVAITDTFLPTDIDPSEARIPHLRLTL